MPFPKVTLGLIHQTLVDGFDGYSLNSGKQLSADTNPDNIEAVSDDALPFLLFDIGNAQTAPWQQFQQSVSWDIPAILKVKGASEDVNAIMLETLQALMQRTQELIGLPINEKGKVTPFTNASARLFDEGKLGFIAERGGPFLRSFATDPSIGSYATAKLVFHVEATLDFDPRGELPKAVQILLGIIPMTGSLAIDPTLPDPYGIPVFPRDSLRGLQNSPPVADADRVVEVLANPYAVSLSAGSPTAPLSAIVKYANWNTVHVERLATWQSTNGLIATVDAAGVVTRVAAGTCTVSCTLNGVTSNGVAITCT